MSPFSTPPTASEPPFLGHFSSYMNRSLTPFAKLLSPLRRTHCMLRMSCLSVSCGKMAKNSLLVRFAYSVFPVRKFTYKIFLCAAYRFLVLNFLRLFYSMSTFKPTVTARVCGMLPQGSALPAASITLSGESIPFSLCSALTCRETSFWIIYSGWAMASPRPWSDHICSKVHSNQAFFVAL